MVKTVVTAREYTAELLVKVPVLIVPKWGFPRAVRFPSVVVLSVVAHRLFTTSLF